ncbi:MAG: DUF4178 domain-containing protein [Leptospiraceae bacterium]|nr:DUF4178 domain-containing protein [Leptospiraceae bacterium]
MAGIEEKKIHAPLKTFSCPNCAGSVGIRAVGNSITAVCSYCNSVISTVNEEYKILEQANQKMTKVQYLELGIRGKLKGHLWEVVGYLERCDGTRQYSWSEYLLFNPTKGFRWLTLIDGHWSFGVKLKSYPKIYRKDDRPKALHLGKDYYLYNEGQTITTFVIGEFYYRIKTEDSVETADFVSSPEMISMEKTDYEVNWTISTYLNPEEVKEAFSIQNPLPIPIDIAPNQPSQFAEKRKSSWSTYFKFLAFAFIIQLASVCFLNKEEVFKDTISFRENDPQKTKVTKQFKIREGNKALDIDIYAPLRNSWIEIGIDLVNDKTGETFEVDGDMEFYSGIDGGESWSEGSMSTTLTLSSIPEGDYHLNIEVVGDGLRINPMDTILKPNAYGKYELPLTFNLVSGASNWSNFLFFISIFIIYPIYLSIRSYFFEVSRWSKSDYNPYSAES